MLENIKVSVCVVTFNQEDYIAECLQSLVDQIANFSFEIIVGDDRSTDGTRKIVDKFAKEYPGLIAKNYHDQNVGAVGNTLSTYKMARGEYICHIDGDDIAHSGKLFEQVAIMDKFPGSSICSHDLSAIDSSSNPLLTDAYMHPLGGVHDLEYYLLSLPFFGHSSKMFRNIEYPELLMLDPMALDIEIHLVMLQYGPIIHIPKVLGCYRVGVGVSSSNKEIPEYLVQGVERLFGVVRTKKLVPELIINRSLSRKYREFAIKSLLNENKSQLIGFMEKVLRLRGKQGFTRVGTILILAFWPLIIVIMRVRKLFKNNI